MCMDTELSMTHGLEPLLGEEVAEYLGVPKQTIYDWRVHGKGPQAYRIGKRIRFTVSDVRAWVATQRDDAVPPPAARSGADWHG